MGFLNAAHIQFLLGGLLWTVGLSLLAFVGGGLLGFAVALGSSYGPRWSRLAVSLYIKLIQGTPLLVLLPLAYFGLPSLGLNVAPLMAAAIALSIYVSAYLGEIWRGCIESVPQMQAEAAECLALRWHQRVWHVILPQALKIATPPTVGGVAIFTACGRITWIRRWCQRSARHSAASNWVFGTDSMQPRQISPR